MKWFGEQLTIFGQGCVIGLALWLLLQFDFFVVNEVLPWVLSALAPSSP